MIGFNIDVTTIAGLQAQSFEIQTLIPQGTTLNPGSVTNGGTVTTDASGSHITWDLPAGTNTQISFSVTVNPLDELPTSLERIEGQATASAMVDGLMLNGSNQYRVWLVRPTFDWSMPQRYGIDINDKPTSITNTILRNDREYVNPAKATRSNSTPRRPGALSASSTGTGQSRVIIWAGRSRPRVSRPMSRISRRAFTRSSSPSRC